MYIRHTHISLSTSCRVPGAADSLHDEERNISAKSSDYFHETPAHGPGVSLSATALPVSSQAEGDSFPPEPQRDSRYEKGGFYVITSYLLVVSHCVVTLLVYLFK